MEKVFFGPGNSVWQCLFMDIYYAEDVEYCDFNSKCNTRFKEILVQSRFSKYIPHGIKRKIYKKILKYKFLCLKRNVEIFFAFTNGFEMFGDPVFFDFLKFLKREYKKAKFALHYDEAIEHCYTEQLPKIKQNFDLVLGFNRYDEKYYGVEYYGPICEKGMVPPYGEGEQSDLFYTGGFSKAGRSVVVLNVFKKVSDANRKCLFFMTGIKPNLQQEMAKDLGVFLEEKDGVNYLKYKKSKFIFRYLPYASALPYINQTKALLEVVYPVGMQSCTPRLAQAMNAGKKLITNCPAIKEEKYYCKENFLYFDVAGDIDVEFFDIPIKPIEYDFSGKAMLDFMIKRLFNN